MMRVARFPTVFFNVIHDSFISKNLYIATLEPHRSLSLPLGIKKESN